MHGDDTLLVESLRMLLTQMGYEVATARDGHSPIEELRRNDYDVVITDLMMDGTIGYDSLDSSAPSSSTFLYWYWQASGQWMRLSRHSSKALTTTS